MSLQHIFRAISFLSSIFSHHPPLRMITSRCKEVHFKSIFHKRKKYYAKHRPNALIIFGTWSLCNLIDFRWFLEWSWNTNYSYFKLIKLFTHYFLFACLCVDFFSPWKFPETSWTYRNERNFGAQEIDSNSLSWHKFSCFFFYLFFLFRQTPLL